MTLLSHSLINGSKAQMEQKYIGNSSSSSYQYYHRYCYLRGRGSNQTSIEDKLQLLQGVKLKTYVGLRAFNTRVVTDIMQFNVLALWNSKSKPRLGQRMHWSISLSDNCHPVGSPAIAPTHCTGKFTPRVRACERLLSAPNFHVFSHTPCVQKCQGLCPVTVCEEHVQHPCLAVTACSRIDGWSWLGNKLLFYEKFCGCRGFFC